MWRHARAQAKSPRASPPPAAAQAATGHRATPTRRSDAAHRRRDGRCRANRRSPPRDLSAPVPRQTRWRAAPRSPPRQIHMLCGKPSQGCGKQRRQPEPREPIMSEGGVEKHRRQNALGKNLTRRALADLRSEQHEPCRTRDQRGGKTPPRNAHELGAQGRTGTPHLTHDRPGDHGAKDDGARQRQGRHKMDHAYEDQRITHPVPPGRRRAPNSRRTYLPTRKVYSPLLEWVSTEVTRHSTLYIPDPIGCSDTFNTAALSSFSWVSPWSTCLPSHPR